jgi:glycerophosphoryl diester phosphodiesterase
MSPHPEPPRGPSGAPPTPGIERVAHRGAPRERLENTLPGFLLALERGADALELDVHVTRDGEVVVHHDYDIRGHVIASSAWSDLSALDLGHGSTMPRLVDVLDAVGARAMMYIELKGVHIEHSVIDVARSHGHRFALHSFDPDAVARVALEAPDIARGILIDRETPHADAEMRRLVTRLQPRDVWPHWSLVDESLMRAARELGVRIIAWTVNSSESARELAALGVNGLCTDDMRVLNH